MIDDTNVGHHIYRFLVAMDIARLYSTSSSPPVRVTRYVKNVFLCNIFPMFNISTHHRYFAHMDRRDTWILHISGGEKKMNFTCVVDTDCWVFYWCKFKINLNKCYPHMEYTNFPDWCWFYRVLQGESVEDTCFVKYIRPGDEHMSGKWKMVMMKDAAVGLQLVFSCTCNDTACIVVDIESSTPYPTLRTP